MGCKGEARMSTNKRGSHAEGLRQRWGIHAYETHMRRRASSRVGVKKGSQEKCRQGNAVAEKALAEQQGELGSGGLKPEARVVLHVLTAPPDT
jgi:hypothetical protein